MIKVSVIIPIYNEEKYLEECLKSVVGQTLREIEIICVNDGSTDDSKYIMDEYAKKDSRIKAIHKENTGYGNSVNCGLEVATGEYIGIVESDDTISKEMYKTLYSLSEEGTVDIIKGNFWNCYYDTENKNTPVNIYVNQERDGVVEMDEPFTLSQNPEILWGHPSIWSAIYRREFLENNQIKFIEEEGASWEDNLFFHETLCKAKGIVWINKPLYYYRKNNPYSSSNCQKDSSIPFVRMKQNLEILRRNHFEGEEINKRAYARALMYTRGVAEEFDYDADALNISIKAKELMQELNEDVFKNCFNLLDQKTYLSYASPIKAIQAAAPKILIYNWLPFDNPWNWGGGVTVYCKNIIEEILKTTPNINIYFLSSGFAYSAKEDYTYVRKIGNIFGERVHQYEIVNSPVPAEQRWMYVNPLVALKNPELKAVVSEFIEKYGPFESVHFNNIEGLSLDVLDLRENYPETKYIFSIHNYVPICVNGSYYMRHKHCNCNPNHTEQDCFKCTRADIRKNIAEEQYKRGLYGLAPAECISQRRWIKKFGFERLDQDVSVDEILKFQKTAVEKINKNCDEILAVSKRVYDIAKDNGLDAKKMHVSYIGTKVAERQVGHATADAENGLKIVFLGNDINYEEKGYPFLLDTLSKLEHKYSSKIDLVLTVKQAEHAEIYTMLKNFRNIKVIQGYTHSDLPWIFEGANLSIVPVLWEDNLPQIAIESVAYGVPVLASSAGGASELCDNKLFRFECGNSHDMLQKIRHFVEKPEDLLQYWKDHHGLVTIKEHCAELSKFYGLSEKKTTIEISEEDWGWLLKEHDFLQKNFKENQQESKTGNEYLQQENRELMRQKEEAERQRNDLQYHLDETRKSKTYKIARAITYIPRKIRGEKNI